MKLYKKISHLCESDDKKFFDLVAKNIKEYQEEGLEVDVQYSSVCTTGDKVVFSALILAHSITHKE